jgi:hypothetical protein
MKMANKMGIFVMTFIFLLCACSGYAAFGSDTPGSILMGSGFKEPFWLVDLANVFIIYCAFGWSISGFGYYILEFLLSLMIILQLILKRFELNTLML